MRVLYLGDVVGRSGRDAVARHMPELRHKLSPDFIVVNGENAAGGFGITEKICDQFFDLGVDVVVTGNHAWDQNETISHIAKEPRLLRPANFPAGTPGRGAGVFSTAAGKKVAVIQVMGRVFMDPLDDPFATVQAELNKVRLGATVDFVLIDIHAEATSEKAAMGHFADGRASLVAGTVAAIACSSSAWPKPSCSICSGYFTLHHGGLACMLAGSALPHSSAFTQFARRPRPRPGHAVKLARSIT